MAFILSSACCKSFVPLFNLRHPSGFDANHTSEGNLVAVYIRLLLLSSFGLSSFYVSRDPRLASPAMTLQLMSSSSSRRISVLSTSFLVGVKGFYASAEAYMLRWGQAVGGQGWRWSG